MDIFETAMKLVDLKSPDDYGLFRKVFFFTYKRRKYVLKIDASSTDCDEDESCKAEFECWNKYKDTAIGKILAPVIAYGTFKGDHNYYGHKWLIMRKLQTIPSLIGEDPNIDEYLRYVVFPKLSPFDDTMMWCDWDNIMLSSILGEDIHSWNVGMDNRGRWYVLDYSDCSELDFYER